VTFLHPASDSDPDLPDAYPNVVSEKETDYPADGAL
jgi:hypothetical protein